MIRIRRTTTLKVLILVKPDRLQATLHRRKPEGGFAIEVVEGRNGVTGLPEIDMDLPLAEL